MTRGEYIKIRNQFDLKKKNSAWVFHWLLNLFLLAGVVVIWGVFHDSWLRFGVILLIFTLIFRGFGIMHEAVHGAVSKNQSINDVLGVLGGSFCLLPFESWKRSHLRHHHWSGNVEKDPVMALIEAYPRMSFVMQKLLSGGWRVWLPILGFLQHVVFWRLSLKPLLKEKLEAKVVMSLLAPIFFWGFLCIGAPLDFVMEALGPSLFLYFIGIEVVNLPHHLGLPQHRGDVRFSVWEQYQIARSCLYPKWFARFVILNFNYHTEHHMFPDAPWYYLDQIHERVVEALKEEYNTDLHLAWILANKKKSMKEVLSSPIPSGAGQSPAA